jgi:hypothetical protein
MSVTLYTPNSFNTLGLRSVSIYSLAPLVALQNMVGNVDPHVGHLLRILAPLGIFPLVV